MPQFIARGAYGCIFRPVVPCHPGTEEERRSKTRPQSNVSKIFRSQEAMRKELRILKLVAATDPRGRFTLPFRVACQTPPATASLATACPYLTTGYTAPQILLPYGGISLKERMATGPGSPALFYQLFSQLLPILTGLQHMLKSKSYIHQDIKPDNIMLLNNKLYLIDFGLAIPAHQVYARANANIILTQYPFFPPEYKYFSHTVPEWSTFYSAAKQNYHFHTQISNTKKYEFSSVFTQFGIQFKQELLAFYQQAPSIHPDPKKVDVFGVGVLLAMLYHWCGMQKQSNPLLFTYIQSLLQPNPVKRLSLTQAITMHGRIAKLFSTYNKHAPRR